MAKQNKYSAAFNKAVKILRNSNIHDVCKRSGAQVKNSNILIRYFNKNYEIPFPELTFIPPNISHAEQILILHYLISTDIKTTKGEYVGFNHLPNGMFYNYAFQKNGPRRILKRFGNNPEEIVDAAHVLGGEQASFKDVSVRIKVFPNIKVIIVLNRGYDEFPPEVNILYKDDIINYLPLEDIAVLGGFIAGHLNKALNKKVKN